MNISQFAKLAFFSVFFSLSGCSAVIKEPETTISVRSDYPDAKIYVSLDGGNTSEFYGTGCAKVSLSTSKLSFVKLIAKKKGCKDGIKSISTNADDLIFVNPVCPPRVEKETILS